MQNVMERAWEIAKEGQIKFGGKVIEYFSEALKIAWSIVKKTMDYAKQVKGTLSKLVVGELQGSEKQVKWAEQIRKEAAQALRSAVAYEEYIQESRLPNGKPQIESRPVKGLLNALVSEETIKAHFEEMKNKGLPESRFVSTVESMNAALDRFARASDILSITDAKFWIDNRSEKDYGFGKLKQYVSTGVKTF